MKYYNKDKFNEEVNNFIMNKKKLLGIIAVATLATTILVGCSSKPVENEPEENKTEEVTKESTIEDILLTYNEDGMQLLKANYPEQEKMELGLKNIGNEISDISLKDLSGKEVNLSQFKGKRVVFEISQDSCEYCMKNTPITHKALAEKDDVILVPIFVNSTVEGIEKFYSDLGLEVPENVLIDENYATVEEFNLSKTPTIIFVDESGKISLAKQEVYDEVTLGDDLKLAFESEKIYDMKVNKTN